MRQRALHGVGHGHGPTGRMAVGARFRTSFAAKKRRLQGFIDPFSRRSRQGRGELAGQKEEAGHEDGETAAGGPACPRGGMNGWKCTHGCQHSGNASPWQCDFSAGKNPGRAVFPALAQKNSLKIPGPRCMLLRHTALQQRTGRKRGNAFPPGGKRSLALWRVFRRQAACALCSRPAGRPPRAGAAFIPLRSQAWNSVSSI